MLHAINFFILKKYTGFYYDESNTYHKYGTFPTKFWYSVDQIAMIFSLDGDYTYIGEGKG